MADIFVSLKRDHNRSAFNCGNAILDRYFHQQVTQDIKKKACACFVLQDEGHRIKSYYTLSSFSVPGIMILPAIQQKITMLGRLAIDLEFHKRGLGELMLMDALKRSYEISLNAVGSAAVVVDPIDENATRFYEKFGFILLPGSGKMFLPMQTIAALFPELKEE